MWRQQFTQKEAVTVIVIGFGLLMLMCATVFCAF